MTDAGSEAPVATPESYVVKLESGDRIHYLDWGQPTDPDARTRPPLILVHGISQTGWIWAPVARRLAAYTRVLTPDLRGHGLSDTPRTGYDLESLAMDMLTIVTANGWGEDAAGPPVVLAGHGVGAIVAAEMASLRPTSVAGLALVDGGWEDIGEATRMSPPEFLAALAEPPEILASMDVFLADRRDFDPESWDEDQERAARAQVDEKHAGHVGLVSRPMAVKGVVDAIFQFQPTDTLAAVPAPMLVLVAESATADDEGARERRLALEDVATARERAGIEPPRVRRFPGAGHNLMRYRPVEVAEELVLLIEGMRPTSGDRRDAPA